MSYFFRHFAEGKQFQFSEFPRVNITEYSDFGILLTYASKNSTMSTTSGRCTPWFAQRVSTYFQVTADMTAEETFAREIVPLRNIRDNYEKIILTLDKVTLGNYDEIRIIHLPDWLLTQ